LKSREGNKDAKELEEFFKDCPGKLELSSDPKERKSGRPKRLTDRETDDLRALAMYSTLSLRALADLFNVSRMTVWRVLYNHEAY